MNEYPEKNSSSKNVKILVNLIILAAVVFVVSKVFVGTDRTLHMVNESGVPASIMFPGQEKITVGHGKRKTLQAPKGKHQVEVQAADRPAATVQVEIGPDKTYILNVGSSAVIAYEETMYSEKLDPNLELPYILHVGEPFFALKKTDFLFQQFPEKIMLYGEEKSKKSRISVVKIETFSMVSYLQMTNVLPGKILSYIEAHLPVHKEDGDLLNMYLQFCALYNCIDRGVEFLSRGLAERPVLTDRHRMYQEIVKYKGEKNKLFAQYDAMLENEPENSALLYLRGRITPGFDRSFDYFDRAIAAHGQNPFPYFAKGYRLAGRGDFVPALELSAAAYKLNPESQQMKEMHYQLRFALGGFNELEKETQVAMAAAPLNQAIFKRLLTVRTAKKDNLGAEMALDDYIKNVKKEMPDDPLQIELQSRLLMAYLRTDFDAFFDYAKKIKNETERKNYFQTVYLNRGEMAKTESLPGIEKTMDRYDCLLYWLGWLDKGQPDKAGRWLEKAREKFCLSKDEDRVVGDWLDKPCPGIVERLLDLTVHFDQKRILYPVFARLCPRERSALLAMAEKLNFSLVFPHHFLAKTIRGMKK